MRGPVAAFNIYKVALPLLLDYLPPLSFLKPSLARPLSVLLCALSLSCLDLPKTPLLALPQVKAFNNIASLEL